MEARVARRGEVTVVHVSGRITYDSVDPFRQQCLSNLREGKVIFNLQWLNFVGSNGVTTFVDTIWDLANSNPEGIRLCGVGSEFEKVLSVRKNDRIRVFADQGLAEYSFLEEEGMS